MRPLFLSSWSNAHGHMGIDTDLRAALSLDYDLMKRLLVFLWWVPFVWSNAALAAIQWDDWGVTSTQTAGAVADAVASANGFDPPSYYCVNNSNPASNGAPVPSGGYYSQSAKLCQKSAESYCSPGSGNYCGFAGYYQGGGADCGTGYVAIDLGGGIYACDVDTGPDCSDTTPDWFQCTGTAADFETALATASACSEGAATPAGCELDVVPGSPPGECYNKTVSVALGGDGSFVATCAFYLQRTGDPADPGDGLPETDSDDAFDTDQVDLSTGTGDDGAGCALAFSSRETVSNNDDGTLERCTIYETTFSGGSCASDGQTDSFSTCVTTYADGSSSTTTTNTEGGVTTTSTKAGGAADPGNEKQDDQGTYAGGTDCSAAPTCKGDALQCAIVDQVWRSRCDFQNDMATYDPGEPTEKPGGTEVDVATEIEGIADVEGWITNRDCPVMSPVTVMGKSVQWSFEGICDAFEILSFLVIGFASFGGYRVIAGVW